MKALIKPELDPDFKPAALWNLDFQKRAEASGAAVRVSIVLMRPDKTNSIFTTKILPLSAENESSNLRYLERILKFLLWQRGASKVLAAGCDSLLDKLAAIYSAEGARHFDHDFFGEKVYREPLEIVACGFEDLPEPDESSIPLGRHLDGCRIGFDLGGSDRKCAAVIDGEVVFSEEIEWNPYFESDPSYHIEGINDSLKRAAAHLPRVDAIGGSSAGIYFNNEVRVASLFRGVSSDDFESRVRGIFTDLKRQWGGIPFDVINDGEVTALAGAMSMGENGVLGLAMGTSQAVGYVTPEGNITPWLNELAFAPVDYRDDAPVDEWSGDVGCGVQYFSQQAVARLAPLAGIELAPGMPFPEQLVEVQKLMEKGDARAVKIYSTIGTYLGYSIAHYADFYEISKILLLGRVTSGQGGSIIIEKADEVLESLFPELAAQIEIVTPNEKDKRHGQAVAAASLPMLGSSQRVSPYLGYIEGILSGVKSARNITVAGKAEPTTGANVLIFSPHPDDECIIGLLALRLMREAGRRIINIPVTYGSNVARQGERAGELADACNYLGWEIYDGNDSLESLEVADVVAILDKFQPEVIFLPHAKDWNSRHISTHLLVMDALKQMPDTFSCKVIENEFWGAMDDPNLMVEGDAPAVADLVAALSLHTGEVARNPYHLSLPAWMQDNVRRGGELVGGQGGEVPDFSFATLYRLRQWRGGELEEILENGQMIPVDGDVQSLLNL